MVKKKRASVQTGLILEFLDAVTRFQSDSAELDFILSFVQLLLPSRTFDWFLEHSLPRCWSTWASSLLRWNTVGQI